LRDLAVPHIRTQFIWWQENKQLCC
jgi:hypothetical protein